MACPECPDRALLKRRQTAASAADAAGMSSTMWTGHTARPAACARSFMVTPLRRHGSAGLTRTCEGRSSPAWRAKEAVPLRDSCGGAATPRAGGAPTPTAGGPLETTAGPRLHAQHADRIMRRCRGARGVPAEDPAVRRRTRATAPPRHEDRRPARLAATVSRAQPWRVASGHGVLRRAPPRAAQRAQAAAPLSEPRSPQLHRLRGVPTSPMHRGPSWGPGRASGWESG